MHFSKQQFIDENKGIRTNEKLIFITFGEDKSVKVLVTDRFTLALHYVEFITGCSACINALLALSS